jgi:hypothetical protein
MHLNVIGIKRTKQQDFSNHMNESRPSFKSKLKKSKNQKKKQDVCMM